MSGYSAARLEMLNRQGLTRSLVVVCAVARMLSGRGLGAQVAVPDSTANAAATLFRSLAGHWSCAGGFARGGLLEADLTFAPVAGDRALAFQHIDRAPSVYWQSATWAVESKTGHIVSVAMAGSTKDRFGGAPALFVASRWSATSITLVADTLKAPPFAPNQFTYTVNGPGALKMVWEVTRNGVSAVGDSLLCKHG